MKNHEILERGLGELDLLKNVKDTRKRITPHETRQNLVLTAPILISATVFCYEDITMERTGMLKIPMA